MFPSEIKLATFKFVARYPNKLRHLPPPSDSFKFVIGVRGGSCYFLPLVIKHQATPLYFTGESVRLPSGVNLLTPNANYSVRTAPLTSKVAFYTFIQQI